MISFGQSTEGYIGEIELSTIVRSINTPMRNFIDIVTNLTENTGIPNELYRWVDAKAARAYMRGDMMKGRVSHWLPREVSGLDKIYPKTGLSFSIQLGKWTSADLPIGFVLRPSAIENRIVYLAGHEIFLFSQTMDLHRSGVPQGDRLRDEYNMAVEESSKNPDEAFVIGDIRDLSHKVARVLYRSEDARSLMQSWCDEQQIELRPYSP